MTLRLPAIALLAALAVLSTAGPVAASTEPGPHTALFAGYWADFLEHWKGVFQQQNGVVMLTLGIGLVCLFVITRGKWKK